MDVLMRVVTSHMGIACADPELLHRFALDRAALDGVSEHAYDIARRHAACKVTFDLETLLRHLVRSAGCSLIEFSLSVTDVDTTVHPASESDIVAVDRPRRCG
jgi:hypothetical protein